MSQEQTTEPPLRHHLTLAQFLLFEAILHGNHCDAAECKHMSEHCECWREFSELRDGV